jgi:hypothetical protein
MTLDLVSVIALVAVAALGSIAGYLTRIVQKFEDKRDQIYLTALPAVYSSAVAFKNGFVLFEKSGNLKQLSTSIGEVTENLSKTIFSGDILVFRTKLHDELLMFYQNTQNLQAIVKEIEGTEDLDDKKEKADNLKLAFSRMEEFEIGDSLRSKPKEVFDQADEVSNQIKMELKGYHSYSWKLIILISVLGATVALIEIIKGYFSA